MQGEKARCLLKSEKEGLNPLFFADMGEGKASGSVASAGAAGAAVRTGDSAGFG